MTDIESALAHRLENHQIPHMEFPTTRASVHTLENGLTVLLDPDPQAPVISTQVWVETGSIHEGRFLGAGISHLLEHMVFKGTERYDGQAISDTVQAAGGEWNAYTTFDRTVYYIDGPAESVETFLSVLTEMVFKPSFPAEEFEKEKNVIRREIDMGMDDPDDRNGRLLYSTAYSIDARRQPVIGHMDLFNQLTRENMQEYHRERYTTENTFICISGDFDTGKILEHLKEETVNIIRTCTRPALVTAEPRQMGQRQRTEKFSIPTSKLTMAWQIPELEHRDSAALDLLATILGTGRSSRLYRNIRERSGLCHHIGSWCMNTPQLPGLFAVSAIVDPEKSDALQAKILEEINQLTKAEMSDELSKAKRITYVNQIRTLATASGRASDLASNWQETRNLNFTRDYLTYINRVSENDLRRCAETYLIPDTLTITSLDPEDQEISKTDIKPISTRGEMITRELNNGLTLVLMKDDRLPTVSITMATLAGLVSETAENCGTNALLSKLIPKGTNTRTGEDIANTMDSLGASYGISCGNNTTLTSASCLRDDLPVVLEIVGDLIQNPSLPEEALERERKTMITELREQEQDPLSVAFRQMRPALFGENGYGLNNGGTEKSLNALTSNSLATYHQNYFTAKNSVLAIFGDIDLEAVTADVEKFFGTMEKGKRMTAPDVDILKPIEIHEQLDKQQAILTVGFHGASAHECDNHALELIHDYCTDMAGPLFTKIREELGLAYYVSATQFHGINTGMFAFYMGTSPEQLDTARSVLLEEIEKIAEIGIPENTLKDVKTTWLASHALSKQKIGAMARLSAIDVLLGFPADHHTHTPDVIRALTDDDIKKAARKYFGKKPVIVTVTP